MKQRNRQMSANLTGDAPFFYMGARNVALNRHKKINVLPNFLIHRTLKKWLHSGQLTEQSITGESQNRYDVG